MSDLDTEIREVLERVTGSVDGTAQPAFEQLIVRRRRRRVHRTALAVLPVVLLLAGAGAGLLLVTGDDDTRVTAGEIEPVDDGMIEEDGDTPESDLVPAGESLLIWLDVSATPPQIAAVAETLQSLREVTEIRFVGPEETWQEFMEYYEHQPEVIDLVEQGQLPITFEVTSTDPMMVAAAVQSLPGVDVIDFEDLTAEGGSTLGPDEEPADPDFDPELLASATGATTIVFGGMEGPVETWDDHLSVWQDGTTTRIGPFSNPWVDNRFIIDRVSDSGPTRIYDLTGRLVCETRLPDQSNVHHVTIGADDVVVLGIEQGLDNWPDFRTEAFAHNCQTGDRSPIEPFTNHLGEGEWIQTERIGGRVFEIHGDAEGNVDPILNEDGIDIVGEDWAGQLAWSVDGAVLVYTNHRDAASLHVTNRLVVRDTRTGQLLWEADLPQPISWLQVIGDQLIIGQGDDRGGWVPTERVAVYDLRLGEQAGQAVVIDNVPPGLMHLD